MTYNPYKVFNVKIKKSEIPRPGKSTFQKRFDEVQEVIYFCESSQSPKQNRELIIDFLVALDEGSQELLLAILGKNWKAGIGRRNLLKVFPGLFPMFEVQLANTYKKNKEYGVEQWIASYKLDGIRGIALRADDGWVFRTRKGKEILTADHLKPMLERLYMKNGYTFWDGELYKQGLPFEQVQGLVMGFTRGTAYEIDYHVFACGNAKEFLSQKVSNVYSTHGLEIEEPQIIVEDIGFIHNKDIDMYLEEAFSLGREGLMLRNPKEPYAFKRSDALLKIKQRGDEGEQVSDCIIKDYVIDDFPVMHETEEGNKIIYEPLIVKLWVEQKDGIMCKVGSGFSLGFRKRDPEELLEMVAEIRHQGYGDKGRMRFPRLERLREDIDETDI
jgi:DNA ligase-1